MDIIYFTGPHSPSRQDWVHCTVERVRAEGIDYTVQSGYSNVRYFAPMHTVQRIEYGEHRR